MRIREHSGSLGDIWYDDISVFPTNVQNEIKIPHKALVWPTHFPRQLEQRAEDFIARFLLQAKHETDSYDV
jgi:hypothetical protein